MGVGTADPLEEPLEHLTPAFWGSDPCYVTSFPCAYEPSPCPAGPGPAVQEARAQRPLLAWESL